MNLCRTVSVWKVIKQSRLGSFCDLSTAPSILRYNCWRKWLLHSDATWSIPINRLSRHFNFKFQLKFIQNWYSWHWFPKSNNSSAFLRKKNFLLNWKSIDLNKTTILIKEKGHDAESLIDKKKKKKPRPYIVPISIVSNVRHRRPITRYRYGTIPYYKRVWQRARLQENICREWWHCRKRHTPAIMLKSPIPAQIFNSTKDKPFWRWGYYWIV